MGACFTVPENTKHPSLRPDDIPQKDKIVQSEGGKSQNSTNENPIKPKNDEIINSNEGKKKATSNHHHGIAHLTKKKDYSAATTSRLINNNEYKRNNENDKDIIYGNDGISIQSQANGTTINEYGNQRYHYGDGITKNQVLDDMLIT